MVKKLLRSLTSDGTGAPKVPARPKFLRTLSTDGGPSNTSNATPPKRKPPARSASSAGAAALVPKRKLPARSASSSGDVRPLRRQLPARSTSNAGDNRRQMMMGMKGMSSRHVITGAAVMEGMNNMATGMAKSLEQSAQELAAGLEAGAALASETLAGGGGKPKGSTAKRRQSELNIFACEGIVTVEFTLDSIKSAEENDTVTKLELEDLVNREDGRHSEVYDAVRDLLKNDGDRKWKYIKFIDSLKVGMMGIGLEELKEYETKRMQLWAHIKEHAEGKPIMFQLKLELSEDTPASVVLQIITELMEYNLARVEFMGALLGIKPAEIGDKLADLCTPEEQFESIEDAGFLKEMVILTLHYATWEIDEANPPTRDRVWKKVLRRCHRRLKGEKAGESGTDLPAMRAAANNRAAAAVGMRMPRRVGSDPNLMKAAIERSMSKAHVQRKAPGVSNTSDHLKKAIMVAGLSGLQQNSVHQKRRKPRRFDTDGSGRDLDSSGPSLDDSDRSFAGEDEDKSKRLGKKNDAAPSKPLRRRPGVVRSISSPMEKRPPGMSRSVTTTSAKPSVPIEKRSPGLARSLTSSKASIAAAGLKRIVKRSESMQAKLRPAETEQQPAPPAKTKKAVKRTESMKKKLRATASSDDGDQEEDQPTDKQPTPPAAKAKKAGKKKLAATSSDEQGDEAPPENDQQPTAAPKTKKQVKRTESDGAKKKLAAASSDEAPPENDQQPTTALKTKKPVKRTESDSANKKLAAASSSDQEAKQEDQRSPSSSPRTEKKAVRRSASLKKQLRPADEAVSLKPLKPAKRQGSTGKQSAADEETAAGPSPKPGKKKARPAYDWSKHSDRSINGSTASLSDQDSMDQSYTAKTA